MEIQTTNLLSVTLQQNRLQSNFTFIDAALRNINEQLLKLSISHDTILKTSGKNRQDIHSILSKLKGQETQISNNSKWIEQMNLQFDDEQNEQQSNQKMIEKEMKSSQNIGSHKNIVEMKVEGKKCQSLNVESSKEKISNEIKADINDKKQSSLPSKAVKSSLQKTLASLKERLTCLEQQHEANKEPIEQLNRILAHKKAREQQQTQRRMRQITNKRKSLKKDEASEQIKPQLQAFTLQAKHQSEKSNQGTINNVFEIFAGKNFQQDNDFASKEMSKEVQCLKENIIDKIRSIEAQYKQNQNRIMNIQKTVDVMERNYELLKYDFDRTSATGWSRQRTNDTQEKGKRDHIFNQTRTSHREFYEQKMADFFQEMDKLRKDYMQIQNKAENEDASEIEQLLKNNDQSASKLSHHKVVNYGKGDSGQNKKEVTILKRELNKLRQQFEEFAWGVNTNPGQMKTVIIKPNETKQDWKALSTKIYKLKMQLQAGVRDLQSKIVTNNDMVVVLNQLQVGIQECRLLIKRKVDQSDYEKGLKRVQTRLNNFIIQVYQKEGKENQSEASLAKQPWFCLSCDTQLKNFTGKVMKSPTNQKLQGKKVNPQTHMVRRYDNNRLPSVVK